MRWWFVLPLLTSLLIPARAFADTESEAKEAYANGRAHFKAGRYNEAVTELKRAYALKPHPALLRYMGDTYYKMNKARLAIDHYRKYLKEAPEAPDKDKVEAKVRQLELIVGAGDEAGETPAPTPVPGPAPEPAPAPQPRAAPDLPTGEDREVPLALRRRNLVETQPQQPVAPKRSRTVPVLKWTTLGLGAASLVMGVVFNRLAAGKASELEDLVRTECPQSSPSCGGNPTMSNPVVQFSERHYNLQQDNKLHQTLSLTTFIVGGVLVGTAAVLFVVDGMNKERPARRAGMAPLIGGGTYGVAGEVSF